MKLNEAIKILHEHGYMLNELNANVFHPSLDTEYKSRMVRYPTDRVYRDSVKLVSDIAKEISNDDTITVICPPYGKPVTDEVIYKTFNICKQAKYVLIDDINTSEFHDLAKEYGLNSKWYTTHEDPDGPCWYILYKLSKAEETPAEPAPKRGFFSRFRSR